MDLLGSLLPLWALIGATLGALFSIFVPIVAVPIFYRILANFGPIPGVGADGRGRVSRAAEK